MTSPHSFRGTSGALAALRKSVIFASLILPSAIFVHLAAEAASLGRASFDVGFALRHLYLGALLLASLGAFALAVGIGTSIRERRRRCALLRADLRGLFGGSGIVTLLAGNIGFFALTQALEGVPIALGSFALGAFVAAIGSLGAALLVFFFGRSLFEAVVEAVIGERADRHRTARTARAAAYVAAPRAAARSYSLFVPNRPPPALSLRRPITH